MLQWTFSFSANARYFAEMSSWAARMHRRAATFGNVVTSCGHPSGPYPRRLEKVKFGVPLEEVCKNDIPGPLLVSILYIYVANLFFSLMLIKLFRLKQFSMSLAKRIYYKFHYESNCIFNNVFHNSFYYEYTTYILGI